MGVSLPVEQWGEGERPVLLLHGFTGNRRAFAHLEPLLSPHLRVFAVDLPGHGDAALPDATGRQGFDETLDALEEVLDRAAPRRMDVVGYSQGARLALALAVRAPSRIRRLVLESVNPGLRRRKERVARREQDEVLARGIERDGVEAFVARWESLPLFNGVRALPEARQAELRARRTSATPAGLAGALRTLGLGVQPSYWASLPRLRVPTLLLTGQRDEKFTTLARKMARELPQAWHRILPGTWHAPHLEQPEEYAAEVTSFLSSPWNEAEFDEHIARLTAASASEARL